MTATQLHKFTDPVTGAVAQSSDLIGVEAQVAVIRAGDAPSEDRIALEMVERHANDFRYVVDRRSWLSWDGKRWQFVEGTWRVYNAIRDHLRPQVVGSRNERGTANASFVAGVERLMQSDPRMVVVSARLDADPWALNTQNGIVDLRNGRVRPHDRAAMCTKITSAAVNPEQGAALWMEFINGITQGDGELAAYLQRLAGYCATGETTEDMLAFLFGIGANGKSSFAEAVAGALGEYALTFPAEVLMEAKGERHPTDMAQFIGVRMALTSEPSSAATWNDSRVKSLTGDAKIAARFMRGDFFTYTRTHKTVVVGNHMPSLAAVTHAIRRRLHMVPFRAVFQPTPGLGMRERLKAEAGGAILAWVVEGARRWQELGTRPPQAVRELTDEYLTEQDEIGQWLAERCERVPTGKELSSDLHRDYESWCERQGSRPKSNKRLTEYLLAAGFKKQKTMDGRMFHGLTLTAA